ncbi:unnamed protein product [Oikopleura dioica]|uniref:Uncharacterized protein n=1 Tax=Oikopleura dioica TaxID=34765 RepID=E4XU68_OIKDI|nr:unnamed protein product [Oikopleura dioica]
MARHAATIYVHEHHFNLFIFFLQTILLAQRQSFSGRLLGNGRLFLPELVIISDQQRSSP